jgi:hypothetical protein
MDDSVGVSRYTGPSKPSWLKNDAVSEAMRKFATGKEAFKWDGYPVLKFGFEKFLAIRLDRMEQRELQFVMGEFMQDGERKWIPGKKCITLKSQQFTKLCGLLFNDYVDHHSDPRNRDSQGNLSFMHNLGENVFFVWSSLDGSPIAHVRLYSLTGQGDWCPSATGTCFGVNTLNQLKAMVKDLSVFKAAKEVYEQRNRVGEIPLPAPNLDTLNLAMPCKMWKKLCSNLEENCVRCAELRMLFRQAYKREASHSCIWGEKDIQLTDEICRQVVRDLEYEKTVLGMVLLLRPWGKQETNIVNCYDFDVNKYFEEGEKKLWEQVLILATREMTGVKIIPVGGIAAPLPASAFPFPPLPTGPPPAKPPPPTTPTASSSVASGSGPVPAVTRHETMTAASKAKKDAEGNTDGGGKKKKAKKSPVASADGKGEEEAIPDDVATWTDDFFG